MSLTLESTHSSLNKLIADVLSDKSVSVSEFREIRDTADKAINALSASSDSLAEPLASFQAKADELSEALQQLTKSIRASKPNDGQLASLREAVEHQLAYLVLTYGATLDRYILTAK